MSDLMRVLFEVSLIGAAVKHSWITVSVSVLGKVGGLSHVRPHRDGMKRRLAGSFFTLLENLNNRKNNHKLV